MAYWGMKRGKESNVSKRGDYIFICHICPWKLWLCELSKLCKALIYSFSFLFFSFLCSYLCFFYVSSVQVWVLTRVKMKCQCHIFPLYWFLFFTFNLLPVFVFTPCIFTANLPLRPEGPGLSLFARHLSSSSWCFINPFKSTLNFASFFFIKKCE